ncbi:hypothetical protein [Halalkalibacter akibai]|uniref:Uncharacterized protein n=1 Tax=Halalkalibacter akibai (strain ATCC 43226 / DSM 21942 / CIP 109018 / JCM 9157 / 1139) TaxID=1236973 RepID=W4QXU0_HALA3|nr:hypothetical protein [Halalkalibacter akibai]GAE36925.1 hypothetical protein JCM9157_4161 [Halalkalibacter akibai JCM 9157]
MWADTFWFVKKEVKYNWPAFLLTSLFVLFFGYLTARLLDIFFVEGWRSSFLLDIIFIGGTPSLSALFMSGPYTSFQTIKTDPYSKKIRFYRSFAIPINVIARSRMIFMLLTLVSMSVLYYFSIFMFLPTSFLEIYNVKDFIMFALIWFGFALTLSGVTPFIEYGTSGKMLYVFSFFTMIGLMVFVFLFTALFNQGIVGLSFQLMRYLGWYGVFLSLFLGCLACYLWHKLLCYRLSRRDYA